MALAKDLPRLGNKSLLGCNGNLRTLADPLSNPWGVQSVIIIISMLNCFGHYVSLVRILLKDKREPRSSTGRFSRQVALSQLCPVRGPELSQRLCAIYHESCSFQNYIQALMGMCGSPAPF